jgi:hypothetical protein
VNYLRAEDGTLRSRPGMGVEAKYLLTGLGVCSCCSSPMKAGAHSGNGRTYVYYECRGRRARGMLACSNDNGTRVEVADAAVLGEVERVALTPQAVDSYVDRALQIVAEAQAKGAGDYRTGWRPPCAATARRCRTLCKRLRAARHRRPSSPR